jgi:N-glycosylase/DNA lyase
VVPGTGGSAKSARTIANSLASKRVSPKGPRSGMRMLTYFVNRAGRALSTERRAELERAKELFSRKIEQQKKMKKRKTRLTLTGVRPAKKHAEPRATRNDRRP